MDSRKCQTATATPAEPGELPVGIEAQLVSFHLVGGEPVSEQAHLFPGRDVSCDTPPGQNRASPI
jgi:hypothetical protein